MDPRANLEEQLEYARDLVRIGNRRSAPRGVIFDDTALRLAELVLALDEWRSKGGFDPYNDPDNEPVNPDDPFARKIAAQERDECQHRASMGHTTQPNPTEAIPPGRSAIPRYSHPENTPPAGS